MPVAERRFPVRIRVGVPPGGFGQRYARITAWLDENCGADGWVMTSSGISTTPSRFTSRMPRWRAPSLPDGAPGTRSRRRTACSRCEMMSRWQETRRACIGRHSAGVPPAFWYGSILRMPSKSGCPRAGMRRRCRARHVDRADDGDGMPARCSVSTCQPTSAQVSPRERQPLQKPRINEGACDPEPIRPLA
jgi:hypothetical protein